MSAETQGFRPEEVTVANPEIPATNTLETEQESPFAVGDMVQQVLTSGALGKPKKITKIESANLHYQKRAPVQSGSSKGEYKVRNTYTKELFVYLEGQEHLGIPVDKIIAANVEAQAPAETPEAQVEEYEAVHGEDQAPTAPDLSDFMRRPHLQTKSDTGTTVFAEPEIISPSRNATPDNDASAASHEPVILDAASFDSIHTVQSGEVFSADVVPTIKTAQNVSEAKKEMFPDEEPDTLDELFERGKEIVSIEKARSVDRIKVWYQNVWYNRHNNVSKEVQADLKRATAEKEQMIAKQATYLEKQKNMQERLGAAAIKAVKSEVEKERAEFDRSIKKLTEREQGFIEELADRQSKRDGYESERNRIASAVVNRFAELRRPYEDKIDALESDRSNLLLAVAEFETKVKDFSSAETSLRESIRTAEFKSEKKALGVVMAEIRIKLDSAQRELEQRSKELNSVDKSLRDTKIPLAELVEIQDEFKAKQKNTTHAAETVSSAQSVTPEVPNTRIDPAADAYEIADPEPVPNASEPVSPEMKRVVVRRTLGEYTSLWNRSFRNKQEIDSKGFNAYLKNNNVAVSDVQSIQQFVGFARRYLIQKRKTDPSIPEPRKFAKDLKAFIEINEHKYTT